VTSVRFRIALLRVNKNLRISGVAYEEHRRVVAGHVPIALFRVKLQREPTRVALGVRRSLLPPTVRNRMNVGVFFPTALNSFAVVYLVISLLVHTNGRTRPILCMHTRSGMRSRLKCAIFSKSRKSSNTIGPRGPTVSEFWLSRPVAGVRRHFPFIFGHKVSSVFYTLSQIAVLPTGRAL